MSLNATIGLFVVELLLLGICIWQERKPADLLKPRLLPYRLFMLILVVMSLATAAQIVALVMGNPVMPRRKMGM